MVHAWLNTVTGLGRDLVRGFVDLLYPATCLVCTAPLPAELDNFCELCHQALIHDSPTKCPFCAAYVGPYANLDAGCPRCRGEGYQFGQAICLGSYDGVLRDAILKIKHHHGEGLAECLGELWAAQQEALLRTLKPDVIVPIPLHWRRRLERGYNQCDALANALAGKLRCPCRFGWLRRIRHTPKQSFQDPKDRKANVKGAFLLQPRRELHGKTVLLVDDVLTTGSTASEAAKVLRKAGAARVVVAVLARAQK